jgi:DNA-binding transcriptional LysR family regulator
MRLIAAAEVDLAVVTGQDAPRGLETQHLFDQPFAWVGPRRGRRDREPLAERLRREPVLRLALESRGRAVLDQYLAEERIRPVSTIDVPSVSLLLSYVSGGLGIGLVPALALAELSAGRGTDCASDRQRGQVVAEPARVAPLPVTLVRRPAARPQPALAQLVSRLTAEGRRVGAGLARSPRAAPAYPLSPARPASRARLAAGR